MALVGCPNVSLGHILPGGWVRHILSDHMSHFDKMNTEEREPFNYYVVRQQNRALKAAMEEKTRRITELHRSLQDSEKRQRSTASLVSCVDRHWKQVGYMASSAS